MNALQLQLLLVVVLVVANAAFAGSEIALISLRRGQIDRLRERGKAGRALSELAEDPNEFLATIQIGITLAGFLASATAATAFAGELAPRLGFLGSGARPVAIIVVTAVLTFVTLVGGELAPKRIAMSRAEGWALKAARPLRWLAMVSRPAVWLLSSTTNLIVRLARVDPDEKRDDMSDEELQEMLLTRAGSHPQRRILEGTFEVGERVLREILVPRRDVTLVPPDATVEDAIEILRKAGHSRAPLGTDLDDISGMVHLNDLAGATGDANAVARDVLFLPETAGVLDALRQLQQRHQTLAVVVDEHGGGDGVVSLEDVLEEIVGEIYDEFDRDTGGSVLRSDDGTMTVDGGFPVHDLPDIGVPETDSEAATVAGIVLERLGRLPAVGERVALGDWTLVVRQMEGRAISQVELRPPAARGSE